MSSHHPYRPFYLAGATGSGKSGLAAALASRWKVEIVNADAFQLYRGIPIITACPSEEERARCPHHLYEVLSPAEQFGAGRYADLAHPCLQEIMDRQRIPLVVGGSGLYLKALTHQLDDAPPADPQLREELNALSLEEIREKLSLVDLDSLQAIEPNNRRYLQRALEISLTTGQPASQIRARWSQDPPGLRGIFLDRPREELYDRINTRVVSMIEAGAIDEVAAVPQWSDTSLKAIGVREIQAHLQGESDLDSCIQQIQQNSRRYAKRQLTWFRRERWMTRIVPASGDAWEELEDLDGLQDG